MVHQLGDHVPNLWDTRSVTLRLASTCTYLFHQQQTNCVICHLYMTLFIYAADDLYHLSTLYDFCLCIALRLGGLCPRLTRVNDAENWPISLELSRKIAPWATVVRISYSQDRCIWSLSYSCFANVSICIIWSRYQATFGKYPIDWVGNEGFRSATLNLAPIGLKLITFHVTLFI